MPVIRKELHPRSWHHPCRRSNARIAFVAVICWLPLGCDREPERPATAPGSQAPTSLPLTKPAPVRVADEWYRAVIGADLREVPFFVSIPPPGAAGGCTIVNGDEHLDVPCRWKDGTTVELEFPLFDTHIQASRDSAGSLIGTWRMSRVFDGGTEPFAATRIARPDPQLRFPAGEPPIGDVSGTWSFSFKALDVGKGVMSQTSDGVVTGTMNPRGIGDMRYLAGNVRGNSLLLSTFDGQHAYVLRADLNPSVDRMKGSFQYSELVSDSFTARRVSVLDVEKFDKVRLRKGATGVTIPALDDPRFRGKPVIVNYFGTWCPSCMDEAPVLRELYRRHHARGLEILGIALEATTDDAYNQRQIEYFRKRYAIPWPIIVASSELADTVKLLPPELDDTGGFPMTLFMDRDRSLRAIHSGFVGPAAGDDYHRLVKTYERHVDEMMAPARPAIRP